MDTTETQAPQHTSFAEFYPFYLSEHSHRTCRRMHFVGSTLSSHPGSICTKRI